VRLGVQLPFADPSFLARNLDCLETKHSAIDAYLWLGYRLGGSGSAFVDMDKAIAFRNEASRLLEVCVRVALLLTTNMYKLALHSHLLPALSTRQAALSTLSVETKGHWERNRHRTGRRPQFIPREISGHSRPRDQRRDRAGALARARS
jgi:hypothetical protein